MLQQSFDGKVSSGNEPNYTRQEVIYGRTFGTALTMDVFALRQNANGAAVLFIVSEGWYSDYTKIESYIPLYVLPLLAGGYTVFAVVHASNPKFALPEYIENVHRAAQFVRYNAATYGIDPDRIGSIGDSAGGHLSLMLGCTNHNGNPEAEDPVDRVTSSVQAVVAFFPPTDFLNWGTPGTPMLGEHPLVPLKGAFDFSRLDPETNAFEPITDPAEREAIAREVSPLHHVNSNNAPTLIVVGNSDTYIPYSQSQILAARLQEAGVPSELIVKAGGGHDEALIQEHLPHALAWFDRHLAKTHT